MGRKKQLEKITKKYLTGRRRPGVGERGGADEALEILQAVINREEDKQRAAIAKELLHQSQLLAAAHLNHLEAVDVCLSGGLDINAVNKEGDTALHIAIANRHFNVVEKLLAARANLEVLNKRGHTPLTLTAKDVDDSGMFSMLWKGLIDSDISLTHKRAAAITKKGRHVLHVAAANNQCDVITLLNELRFDEEFNVNIKTREGEAALHVAAQHGHVDALQTLLDMGADFLVEDNNGATCLCWAAFRQKWDCYAILDDRLTPEQRVHYVKRRLQLFQNYVPLSNREHQRMLLVAALTAIRRYLTQGEDLLIDINVSVSLLKAISNATSDYIRQQFLQLLACLCYDKGDSSKYVSTNLLEHLIKADIIQKMVMDTLLSSSISDRIAVGLFVHCLQEVPAGKEWLSSNIEKVAQAYIDFSDKLEDVLESLECLQPTIQTKAPVMWSRFSEYFLSVYFKGKPIGKVRTPLTEASSLKRSESKIDKETSPIKRDILPSAPKLMKTSNEPIKSFLILPLDELAKPIDTNIENYNRTQLSKEKLSIAERNVAPQLPLPPPVLCPPKPTPDYICTMAFKELKEKIKSAPRTSLLNLTNVSLIWGFQLSRTERLISLQRCYISSCWRYQLIHEELLGQELPADLDIVQFFTSISNTLSVIMDRSLAKSEDHVYCPSAHPEAFANRCKEISPTIVAVLINAFRKENAMSLQASQFSTMEDLIDYVEDFPYKPWKCQAEHGDVASTTLCAAWKPESLKFRSLFRELANIPIPTLHSYENVCTKNDPKFCLVQGHFHRIVLALMTSGKECTLKTIAVQPGPSIAALQKTFKRISEIQHWNIAPLMQIFFGETLISLLTGIYERHLGDFVSDTLTNEECRSELEAWSRSTLTPQLIDALAFLHSRSPPIVHGRLKPSNILLRVDNSIVISDVGMTECVGLPHIGITVPDSGDGISAASWRAREQLMVSTMELTMKMLTPAADMQIAGMLIYYSMTGNHPFGKSDEECQRNILCGAYQIHNVIRSEQADQLDLVKSLIVSQSTLRITASEALRHPMFWGANKRTLFLTCVHSLLSGRCDPNVTHVKERIRTLCWSADNNYRDVFERLEQSSARVLNSQSLRVSTLDDSEQISTSELMRIYNLLKRTHWTILEVLRPFY